MDSDLKWVFRLYILFTMDEATKYYWVFDNKRIVNLNKAIRQSRHIINSPKP